MPGIIIGLEQPIKNLLTNFSLLDFCFYIQHSGLTALDCFNEVDHSYGIDEEGPEASDEEGMVVVPELNFQLSPTDYQRLRDHVDPLSPSENYGIDLYEQTVQFSDSL